MPYAVPPLVPGAPPRVVTTRDDVLAILPRQYKQAMSAPVRDTLADSLLALLLECQYRADYAASQSDVSRATGEYLDGLAEDRKLARAQDEPDEQLRPRILNRTGGVTFTNIRAAINLVLSPFTDIECQIIDAALDRWFVGGSPSRKWHSFIGRTPSYPSRLYEHDAPQNGGIVKLGTDPAGARVFNGHVGRMFYVRVPHLSGLNSARVTIESHSIDLVRVRAFGFFVSSGGAPTNAAFISRGATALSVYTAIKNTVQQLIGHSIRWVMVSDPKLS